MRLVPDISSLETFYDRGKFMLAWRISVAFTLIFGTLSFVYRNDTHAALPTTITLFVSAGCLIYLAITKKYAPLFWIYAISGTLLTHFAVNYVLDFTHYVDFMWMIASILVAFIGLGSVYGILFVIIHATGIAYFLWFTLNKHIVILEPRKNFELIGDYLEMLFAFFVIAYLMRQFIQFQTHSEYSLKNANANLAEQNQLIQSKRDENEILIKEIHHRVKNNLQIIISLLRMQRAELKSEESQSQFSEAINRIMAMSLIHQKLYGEKDLSKVNLKSYLEQLTSEIISIFPNKHKITVEISTHIKHINLDTIVPLGLLVNELISNSLKYAFKSENDGVITMSITQNDGHYYFDYGDNGTWVEPDENSSSFGSELIDILTEQLNGEKILDTVDGTNYHFTLKESSHA